MPIENVIKQVIFTLSRCGWLVFTSCSISANLQNTRFQDI